MAVAKELKQMQCLKVIAWPAGNMPIRLGFSRCFSAAFDSSHVELLRNADISQLRLDIKRIVFERLKYSWATILASSNTLNRQGHIALLEQNMGRLRGHS